MDSVICVRDIVPQTSKELSAIEDDILAYPKYSPDLLAEKIKNTSFPDCTSNHYADHDMKEGM
jgi:hypothetical protein